MHAKKIEFQRLGKIRVAVTYISLPLVQVNPVISTNFLLSLA